MSIFVPAASPEFHIDFKKKDITLESEFCTQDDFEIVICTVSIVCKNRLLASTTTM